MDDDSTSQEEIVNGVVIICRILLLGILLAAAVIFARLFGRGGAVAFASGSINVPANYAWILFLVLTLGHRLYAAHLVRNILSYWNSDSTVDDGQNIFREIRVNQNMFVFGLIPRVRTKRLQRLTLFIMEHDDPSTAFTHFALLAFLISMFPWYITSNGDLRWSRGWALWLPIVAALIIAERNWRYGSYWIVALSQLTLEKGQASMLERLKRHQELIQQRNTARKDSRWHKRLELVRRFAPHTWPPTIRMAFFLTVIATALALIAMAGR